ncbi:Phosphotyrosyl phosphatase activator [Microthyrium microscopicum]|uniref:Serine/threonine-protein phosphatase 2A activator n=1 Tax=Microthyrium microscopicum TaxID=703497 RepID=A0A6A6UHD8_9PEZI|nr:Phosphotyrosyl phosphatase activator [Microthyrium microscopicum]
MTASPIPSNPPDLSNRLPPLIPRRRNPSEQSQPLEPAPETPSLPEPVSLDAASFQNPTRRILSPRDLELFQKSPTYSLILAFIFGISDAVRNKTTRAVATEEREEVVTSILEILNDAKALLKEHPALDTGSRFGNPIFRSYLDSVSKKLEQWHKKLGVPAAAIQEASTYLEHSFGSADRIDYGSGHELNFFLWLLCLNRLSLLPKSTFPALALVVFPQYLQLMRSIQMTYYLEPAGSHGVWGLDDYQFLPFLFGAAQLAQHRYITPKSIHNAATLEECSKDFLYLDQVAFVNSVKNVEGLRWHSPMLDDISAAKSWTKIEAGMKKMFVKEVLGKLPVMQHFLFGSMIPAAKGMSEDAESHDIEHDHDHAHESGQTWDDCCGIKVPSSLGAAGEEKRRGGESLRRIPFD